MVRDITGTTREPAVVAVIPARGGSKRIPDKNVRMLHGIPIIARTIAAVKNAGIFDTVIVSTESERIAEVASDAGAEVPFLRPKSLADDYTATRPVIQHAIREVEKRRGMKFSIVGCIYPTAALIPSARYREAVDMLQRDGVEFVFGGLEFPHPIQRAYRREASGRCEMLWPEYRGSRSQDLEPAFHDAGQFYVGEREAWLESRRPHNRHMLVLTRLEALDVDTVEDWQLLEMLTANTGS